MTTQQPLNKIEQDRQFLDTLRLDYFNGRCGLASTLCHLQEYFKKPLNYSPTDEQVKVLWILVMRPYLGNCKPPRYIRWGYNGGCECQDLEERRRTHSAFTTTSGTPSLN